ncbi:MAG: alpha/beta fold hydrolase [Candidatus Dormibacteria bacterium]
MAREPRPDLDDLLERFERVAEARAVTGKLDAPAEDILAEVDAMATSTSVERGVPPGPAEDLAAWWAGGERIAVELPGGISRHIFVRVMGSGPWLTCLHGFPTSSWDWARVAPALALERRLLVFDLLGFGESDKPAGHDWSAFEQADIVEALWRRLGVEQTDLLAHDVGLTVGLELLARRQEGALSAAVNRAVFLNGGVYAGYHRPRPIQVALQRPLIGALIARLLSERRFGPALAEVFGPTQQPSASDLHQHWLSVARRDGNRNYHRLIRYIPERRLLAARWEGALEQTTIPLRFVWGMADPVSGAHMAEVIRERLPGAEIIALEGVGHYPHLEAPAEVVEAVRLCT